MIPKTTPNRLKPSQQSLGRTGIGAAAGVVLAYGWQLLFPDVDLPPAVLESVLILGGAAWGYLIADKQ